MTPASPSVSCSPNKFLAKHYPVRSQAHGERKVLGERVARWNLDERKLGWHHQYEPVTPGHTFIQPTDGLSHHDDGFATEYLVERLTGVGIVAAALHPPIESAQPA